jgi:hypothetical protein
MPKVGTEKFCGHEVQVQTVWHATSLERPNCFSVHQHFGDEWHENPGPVVKQIPAV